MNQDIGFDAAMLQSTSDAYWQYMSVVYAAVLARGKFVWQQMWRVLRATLPTRACAGTCAGACEPHQGACACAPHPRVRARAWARASASLRR